MQEWSERTHRQFSDLIGSRTGLVFPDNRGDLLRRGVASAAQSSGESNLARYYTALQAAPTVSDVWDDLVGAITIGETYFFRNAGHFQALEEMILPEILERHGRDRRIRIWSAACSSGEEPYSIAMTLRKVHPDLSGWNISILGTDISIQSLQRARRGVYREWSFRRTPSDIRQRYFAELEDGVVLSPSVREMVRFSYLNQKEDYYPTLDTGTHALDLIFCRNLSIYFGPELISEIAGRFFECLVPGGWLVVGASETNSEIYKRYDTVNLPGAIVYRKPLQAALEAPSEPVRRTPATPTPPRLVPRPVTRLNPAPGPAVQSAGELCDAARKFAREGSLSLAIQKCDQAVERDPLYSSAYYVRALLHLDNGAREACREDLRRLLYLDPDFLLGHFALANLYEAESRTEDATRHRTRAARLAAKLGPEETVPGSSNLTVKTLIAMLQAMAQPEDDQ